MNHGALPDRFSDAAGEASAPRLSSAPPAPISGHGPVVLSQGTAGTAIALPPPRKIGLWQLTSPLQRRIVDGRPEPIPSAEAVPVWGLNAWGQPGQTYAPAGHVSSSARLYHTGWAPGDRRTAIETVDPNGPGALGIPRFSLGDWVHAGWNHQTGRWEILGPSENVWRFELTESLWPTAERNRPSTARARLLVFDPVSGRYEATPVLFDVADFFNQHTADAGARGYARRLADSHWAVGWEIIALQPLTDQTGGSSYWSSGSPGGATACECLSALPAYHFVRFHDVLDDECDACYRWEDAFYLGYWKECLYAAGCVDGEPRLDCESFPCDEGSGDTNILLGYYALTEGRVRVDVTVYQGIAPRAVFSRVIDPEAEDPSHITGMPCMYGTIGRCNWRYSTCDIFL